MDIAQWVQELINQYREYAFWLILLFGIAHPLTENPWSFLTMSIAITVLGIPLGYGTLLFGNIVGILLLYVIMHSIRKWSKDALLHKKVSKAVLDWINQTETWRHVIVIGMPSIPTYPIKIALPLSKMTFQKYFFTLLGSYLFLYIGNTLLYYGIIGIVTDAIPKPIAIGLLIIFVLYIYFGKSLRNRKEAGNNEVNE